MSDSSKQPPDLEELLDRLPDLEELLDSASQGTVLIPHQTQRLVNAADRAFYPFKPIAPLQQRIAQLEAALAGDPSGGRRRAMRVTFHG